MLYSSHRFEYWGELVRWKSTAPFPSERLYQKMSIMLDTRQRVIGSSAQNSGRLHLPALKDVPYHKEDGQPAYPAPNIYCEGDDVPMPRVIVRSIKKNIAI